MARSVEEWIGASDDTPVPPRVRLRQFERDRGCCRKCGRKLYPQDKPQCDHVKALKLGGENREQNLQTLCDWCHKEKTTNDQAQKSKTYRAKTKYLGIKPARKHRWGYGKEDPKKKKIGGEVVMRD